MANEDIVNVVTDEAVVPAPASRSEEREQSPDSERQDQAAVEAEEVEDLDDIDFLIDDIEDQIAPLAM